MKNNLPFAIVCLVLLSGCMPHLNISGVCLEDCIYCASVACNNGYGYRIWIGPVNLKNSNALHCQVQIADRYGNWHWVRRWDNAVISVRQDDFFDPEICYGTLATFLQRGLPYYEFEIGGCNEKKN